MRDRIVPLLWNGRTRRPRAVWRILAAFVVLALVGLAITLASTVVRGPLVAAFGAVLPGPQSAVAVGNLLFLANQGLAAVGAVYVVGRFADRRRFVDFGLHGDRDWWVDLGFGLALGAALMSAIVAVEYAAGWLVLVDTFMIARPGFSFPLWFAWSLLTFVGIGVTEELLVRGYLLKNGAEGLTWFDRLDAGWAVGLAVAGSSLVFGLGHAVNPNASLASTAGIFVASLMLSAGYVLTGELAIPIGIHITWNFFQGSVYGFPVSGLDFGIALVSLASRGPDLLTGGAFGPEAGLLGVAASLVGTGGIAAWVWWRSGTLRIAPSVTTPDRLPGTTGEDG